MRIGIDLLPLSATKAGIRTYCASLVEALARVDRVNQYVLFEPREAETGIQLGDSTNFSRVSVRTGGTRGSRVLVEMFLFRELARHHSLDVFHAMHQVLPFGVRCATVLSIHDLVYRDFPDSVEPVRRAYFSQLVPWSATRADCIIAISEFTKERILADLKIDESKVVVTYEGPGRRLPTPSENPLRRGYILTVGSMLPHKNLRGLVRAFEIAVREYSVKEDLVIAGLPLREASPVRGQIDSIGLTDRVHLLGFVSDNELADLYQYATCFALVSFYEGFGLPLLEAMRHGCPVVCSNTTALPEIAGTAAVLVPPSDAAAIAKGLVHVCRDKELRGRLRSEGYRRASEFTWERTAELTVKAYEAAFERALRR